VSPAFERSTRSLRDAVVSWRALRSTPSRYAFQLVLGAALVGAVLFGVSSTARAVDPPAKVFESASQSLASGQSQHGAGAEYTHAITLLESLADRGFIHPDVSFDRGVAYAKRAQTKEEEPGDLGRAAAAFSETLLLRPDDREAEAALDTVRAEVTKRRSRRAKDDLIVRPSLDRLVIGLATEEVWSALAAVSSLLFAIGLLLRRRPTGLVHVAGSVLWPVALLALCVFAPLAFGARWLREHRRPGVIVASEATLLNEAGAPTNGPTIPEAAAVEVGDSHGDTIFVRWGTNDGYVPLASVRVLAR